MKIATHRTALRLLTVALAIALAGHVYAQKSISGQVLDERGSPLIGVQIIEKGTANGAITDLDGNYALELSNETSTMVLSLIGMSNAEINLEEGALYKYNSLDIQLGAGGGEVILYCWTDHGPEQEGPHGGPDKEKMTKDYECENFINCDS